VNHNLRVRAAAVGLGVVALAAGLYWLSARDIHSDRRDFYYLADAFLHGRTWLTEAPGPFDVIGGGDGRWYLPFAPFPAIAFMPLVALIGPVAADHLEPGIHAALAAGSVGLCWMLLGRIGVADLVHRFWVVALFGFSTVIWWVTARGGVWHTGQLIATVLTFGCLVELFGRPRVAVIGLMAGAAFLTRAPLALAVPFYMLLLPGASVGDTARRYGGVLTGTPVRQWLGLGLGTLPAIAFFFWYDAVRFGDPRESGYALASVIGFLDERRDLGLFSTAHLGMNLELLFLRLPVTTPDFPYIKPEALACLCFSRVQASFSPSGRRGDRPSRGCCSGRRSPSSCRHCSTTAEGGCNSGIATSWTPSRLLLLLSAWASHGMVSGGRASR